MVFNDISVMSLQSVLLVEEIEYPEKTIDLPQVTDKFNHIILYRVHLACAGFELTTFLVIAIGTDCIDSSKSNYHMITTTTASERVLMDNTKIYGFQTTYINLHKITELKKLCIEYYNFNQYLYLLSIPIMVQQNKKKNKKISMTYQTLIQLVKCSQMLF